MKNDGDFNPFPMSGYHGSEFFCDRAVESKSLVSNLMNGVNTTLLSERRMGKTGLIHHVFSLLAKKKYRGIYVDIQSCRSIKDMTNLLGTAIFREFPEKQKIGKQFMQFIRSMRTVLSFDSLSGSPELRFEYNRPREFERGLDALFNFLENLEVHIVIAFDEFQQVTNFPEKNIEAILRSRIQHLKNVNFVFSGSNSHMLVEMFASAARPFFSSTQYLSLAEINEKVYKDFIRKKFLDRGRRISEEALDFILEWTGCHTFYTQALSNRIYTKGNKKIDELEARAAAIEILNENEAVYFQYRNLLTQNQWDLLNAVARREKVYQPTSREFIETENLGSSSLVLRSLNALLDAEMIYKKQEGEESYYRVYDRFLARWLEAKTRSPWRTPSD